MASRHSEQWAMAETSDRAGDYPAAVEAALKPLLGKGPFVETNAYAAVSQAEQPRN